MRKYITSIFAIIILVICFSWSSHAEEHISHCPTLSLKGDKDNYTSYSLKIINEYSHNYKNSDFGDIQDFIPDDKRKDYSGLMIGGATTYIQNITLKNFTLVPVSESSNLKKISFDKFNAQVNYNALQEVYLKYKFSNSFDITLDYGANLRNIENEFSYDLQKIDGYSGIFDDTTLSFTDIQYLGASANITIKNFLTFGVGYNYCFLKPNNALKALLNSEDVIKGNYLFGHIGITHRFAIFEPFIDLNVRVFNLDCDIDSATVVEAFPGYKPKAKLKKYMYIIEPRVGIAIGFTTGRTRRFVKKTEKPGIGEVVDFDNPPMLRIAKVELIEPSNNGALDAGEKASLNIHILNEGKGPSRDINVYIKFKKAKGLEFKEKARIDRIYARSKVIVNIPVVANYSIKNDNVNYRILAIDKNGFSSNEYEGSFVTRKYTPPKLELVNIGIDDDNLGESIGDGDNKIEINEKIEAVAFIKNKGSGIARGVIVDINLKNNGDNIFYTGDSDINIGNIEPGAYKEVKFSFTINSLYKKNKVPIKITAITRDRKYEFKKEVELALNRRLPGIKQVRNYLESGSRDEFVDVCGSDLGETKIKYRFSPDAVCVIFGIEDYKYVCPATWANDDATCFYSYAVNILGIPEERIFFRAGKDATIAEIEKVFKEDGWIERKLNKDGKTDIIFYYSGHGFPVKGNTTLAILGYDSDPEYDDQTIRMDWIYSNLQRMHANRKFVFLDACFSGISRTQEPLLPDKKPFVITSSNIFSTSDIITITASKGNQYSSSYPQVKHGLFTYYLLRAIKGEADSNKDRSITIGELYNYVKEQVEKTASKLGISQTPMLYTNKRRTVFLKRWIK